MPSLSWATPFLLGSALAAPAPRPDPAAPLDRAMASAEASLRDGELQAAESHYRTALRIDPKYPQAHFNLANWYLRTGNLTTAIHHFSEAVRLAAVKVVLAIARSARSAQIIYAACSSVNVAPSAA